MISPTVSEAPAPLPPRGSVFRWTPEQQIVGYRSREKIEPVRVVGRGAHDRLLPMALHQISPHWVFNGQSMDVDSYIEAQRVSGVLVLKEGRVLLERYGLGRTEKDHWDIQSSSKSVTAILVGAAIKDGYIKSMDVPVTEYIPELKGSVYEGVTIRQLMTMTSGVKFDQDYFSANGDGIKLWSEPFANGLDPTVAYMRRQLRADQPGTKFVYKDPDTDLVAIMVFNAVGKSMSEYLSEKLWQPCGMEQNAYWMVDPAGIERGGCGISMSLRDFARIGLFMLEGGKAGGVEVLPPDWMADAISTQMTFPSRQPTGATGYGYFWWIYKDSYAALGHSGQTLFIYPNDKVVIVTNSAWPEPNQPENWQALNDFVEALHAAAVAQR